MQSHDRTLAKLSLEQAWNIELWRSRLTASSTCLGSVIPILLSLS